MSNLKKRVVAVAVASVATLSIVGFDAGVASARLPSETYTQTRTIHPFPWYTALYWYTTTQHRTCTISYDSHNNARTSCTAWR